MNFIDFHRSSWLAAWLASWLAVSLSCWACWACWACWQEALLAGGLSHVALTHILLLICFQFWCNVHVLLISSAVRSPLLAIFICFLFLPHVYCCATCFLIACSTRQPLLCICIAFESLYLLRQFSFAIRCPWMVAYAIGSCFASPNSSIYTRSEPLKIGKAIEVRRQSIE